MLGLLLLLPATYLVLLRGRSHLLLPFLLVAFGIFSLPSELKAFFVLEPGGVLLYPQDLLLLIAVLSMATDARLRASALSDRPLLALVLAYVGFHVVTLVVSIAVAGFQLDYLRMTLFGALWILLVLFRFDLSAPESRAAVSTGFVLHNVLAVAGAASLLLVPGANDPDSRLSSHIGFSSTGYEEDSLILVTGLSGAVAIIALWYYLMVERRGLLAPASMLAVVVIVLTSHRIDYVALALLLAWYGLSGQWLTHVLRRPVKGAVLAACYLGMLVSLLLASGLDVREDILGPFMDRAASLFNSSQVDTVNERFAQYSHFLNGYLADHGLVRYLVGEGYLPTNLRDFLYQWAQPHNFLLFSVLNIGFIGTALLALVGLRVVVWRQGWRSPVFLPLCLLMVTQLTDAGFTQFPISAYLAILLSGCATAAGALPGVWRVVAAGSAQPMVLGRG